MDPETIDKIEPWKTERENAENKYLEILKYLKKRLKDINEEEHVSVYSPYQKPIVYSPVPYEYGDRLDPSQKEAIMVDVTIEYYKRYNIIMTKKTQLKLMLATQIMSWKEYLGMNWDFYKIFS